MSDAGSSGAGEKGALTAGTADATAVELATGLSAADVDLLGSDASPAVRAEIAAKFAGEYDRLANDKANRLTDDLLMIFSRDQDQLVRKRFADSIKASRYLPQPIAARLARDHINVATPILLESPVLDDALIGDIIQTMSEAYSLVIAGRQPLSEELVDLMIEHRGTLRIAARLLDNAEAGLSDEALLRFREWGRSNQQIAHRLTRRPNLPFAFVNQNVAELAEKVQWRSLGERAMSKFEATQLQRRIEGKSGHRCSPKGDRFLRMNRILRYDFERGRLEPSTLLTFLRDQDVDRLECGFAIVSGLDLRTVRSLLYDSDRRGLVALCLRADFSTSDYLAFRMALSLAELGTMREKPVQKYDEKALRFACDQFEQLRANPNELKPWLRSDVA